MKPYIASELPIKDLDYESLIAVVGRANAGLARYDGLLQGIPNPTIMLSPLAAQEAVLSSRIEGTQATLDEVLEHEAGMIKQGEKERDIQEIINYRIALVHAAEHLGKHPVRLGLVCDLHKILMDSVRGENKSPGEFRKEQNWIGHVGCTIEQATFVPPDPSQLTTYLKNWEAYMDGEDVDPLIQTAIVHAQFELLHPFKDGNGRIGRILIPLFLYQKKILSQPMFYLSAYLEANRDEYYQRLQAISQDRDWNGWVDFFLRAIAHQAVQDGERVRAIMSLYDEMKDEFQAATRSQYSIHLLDAIFNRPIFQVSELARRLEQDLKVHGKTPPTLLKRLRQAGLLTELRAGKGSRTPVWAFEPLVNVVRGQDAE